MTDAEVKQQEELVDSRREEVPRQQKLVGAFGDLQEPDETTHQLLDTFLPKLEETVQSSGENTKVSDVADVKIIGVQRQVVAGTNHKIFLEIKSSGSKFVMTIFEPLPSARAAPELMGVEKHEGEEKTA
ncbi:Cystatin-A2 [Hondaea fermentalgiana]|uniref:Cystatin-A2 n=1 Tax=Hondaea fermentalgiana TaxID=2315210 RepID=A0A2R5GJQ4_9STRA|nr:Cystatin-A2 [Hondaea fermentalgiana]|eukprot:GBG31126.1 Cystatin-A2 [Hondaea fermentalgiana]